MACSLNSIKLLFIFVIWGLSIMRCILYSLRDIKGSTILSIDLTTLILSETNSKLTINLPSGSVTINKFDWLNREIIYDDGRHFFLICNKQASREWAFKTLMRYAILKVNTRLDNLIEAKERYIKELDAA